MRNLEELEIDRGQFERNGEAVDTSVFEAHFQLDLSPEFRHFLKNTSGGYPWVGVFRKDDDEYGIGNLFYLTTHPEPESLYLNPMRDNLWDKNPDFQTAMRNNKVVVFAEGGANAFFIDYTEGEKIYFRELATQQIIFLCNGFGYFIDSLEYVD